MEETSYVRSKSWNQGFNISAPTFIDDNTQALSARMSTDTTIPNLARFCAPMEENGGWWWWNDEDDDLKPRLNHGMESPIAPKISHFIYLYNSLKACDVNEEKREEIIQKKLTQGPTTGCLVQQQAVGGPTTSYCNQE